MNMMNKCAKFHKDSPSDKKVKFNLPSAIELRRQPILCTTLFRNFMQASNFGGTFDQLSFEFVNEIFTEDASLLLLYHGAKKSKMTKNSNQGGVLPKAYFRYKTSDRYDPDKNDKLSKLDSSYLYMIQFGVNLRELVSSPMRQARSHMGMW